MKSPLSLVLPFLFLCLWTFSGCGKTEQTGNNGGGSEAAESAEVSLRHALKAGDTCTYMITTVEKVKVTQDTVPVHRNQTVNFRYRLKVLEANPGGGGTLEATCLSVVYTNEISDGKGNSKTIRFDSRDKHDAGELKMFALYNAPVNTPFTFTVDSAGEIQSFAGTKPLVKRLLMDDYATMKFETKNQLEKDYPENSLKPVLQLVFQYLPPKPVRMDSSWERNVKGNLGFMKTENISTYTLKGFEETKKGNLATIDARFKAKYIGENPMEVEGGSGRINRFDIVGKGAITFNATKGRLEKKHITQTIVVDVLVQPSEEMKQADPRAKDMRNAQEATVENTIEAL